MNKRKVTTVIEYDDENGVVLLLIRHVVGLLCQLRILGGMKFENASPEELESLCVMPWTSLLLRRQSRPIDSLVIFFCSSNSYCSFFMMCISLFFSSFFDPLDLLSVVV